MAYRATRVSSDPLAYFIPTNDLAHPESDADILAKMSLLHVSDVVVRANLSKEIFSELIRFGTNSHWSHSALLYLVFDQPQGFYNTFLVEAMTSGVRVASWRNEVFPYQQFNVGLRRLNLDWYVEMPQDIAKRNPNDPEDAHGVEYLRHVRGIAVDQINSLYDHTSINEITSLMAARFAKEYFGSVPEVVEATSKLAEAIQRWYEFDTASQTVWQRLLVALGHQPVPATTLQQQHEATMRFICSGLVQYSFFAALCKRIDNNFKSDAAQQNLSNLHRVVFRDDPEGIIPTYIQEVQSGKRSLGDDPPPEVLTFLKTTVPGDFNSSPNLDWLYIIDAGVIWQIAAASDDYKPQSAEEGAVLALMGPLHP